LLGGQTGLWQPGGSPSQSQSQSQGPGGPGGGVSLFVAGGGGFGGWWPDDLGAPASTGAQNDIRYAFFPAARRLAIQIGGRTTLYDSGDHRISGVSQQQRGDASLTFTSQHGVVRVADLPVVPPAGGQPRTDAPASGPPHAGPAPSPPPPTPSPPLRAPAPASARAPVPEPVASAASSEDIFATLERLAQLRDKGIVSDEEFAAKKAELLARL
jgi:hypothetical protein